MREDLLHFIWKYKKLQLGRLVTTSNETITVLEVGSHNQLAGPDFFNAKIQIDGQLWAGNVEIHINSSDWYAHHHEQDPNYDNVILHVVWNDDMHIKRKDQSLIPTLALKNYISKELLNNYKKLFDNRGSKFINCESEIGQIDEFIFNNWLTRLYIERLEGKSVLINTVLRTSKNDWERVLFTLLLKNFGLKINGESFLSLAKSIDFSMFRKLQNQTQVESLFFGLAGLLNEDSVVDAYFLSLKKEFEYLKQKFGLDDMVVARPEFFKLRPHNFPTIRLSQFAQLYLKEPNLFSKILQAKSVGDFYKLFDVSASDYWDDHFTFGKVSRKSNKKLSKKFIDLLLINTIIPLRFSYYQHKGENGNEEIFDLIGSLKAEQNGIINKFETLGVQMCSSKESQSVLQLYNEYCIKNKCMQCVVGGNLLSGNI